MPVAEVAEAPLSTAEFISIEEAARLIGVEKQTLDNWRSARRGPPFIKISRRIVRYKKAAVLDWIDARTIDPGIKTAQAPTRERKAIHARSKRQAARR